MPDDPLPSEELCPNCGEAIDTTGFEPLTPVGCPSCGEEILVGRAFGDYDLIAVMGRGGMGVVYRAVDRALQRPVALKLLRPEQAGEDFLAKLEQEAAITASINHPHVVKVFTTGTHHGRFFLAMELVDKGTLDDLIELQGRVAEAQALEIASQIAQGLRAAYQSGLIHRDVKPGNILFADAHSAKIVDFGLAIMEEAAVGSDEIWGTPYYVSPERLDQKPEDFRSDMYSLGATIFHAIAGRPPFEAEDATMVALKHLKNEAVSLQAFAPWVTGSTAFVINRTLCKDPHDRYASYDEFIEHLEYARNEILSGQAKPVAEKRVVLETDEDRKRQGLLASAIIGVVLLLGLGTGAYFYFAADEEKPIAGPAATASVGATGKLAERYEGARQFLLHDGAKDAAPIFQELANQPETPERLSRWSQLQAGLSLMIAGKADEARTAFSKLKTKPYKGKDEKLGAFFQRVAALGSGSAVVPPDSLKDVDPHSYNSLLLLIAGLRDWELGSFDEGVALLRDFKAIDPNGQFIWLTEYRELADNYVSDYADYNGALATARQAQSPAELQNAAKLLRKVQGDLKRSPVLAGKLEQAAVTASNAAQEKGRQAAEKAEAEKKAMGAMREKVAGLARDWKMKEARAAAEGFNPSTAETLREARLLARKAAWLSQFKEGLIKDLAKGGEPLLKTKDGHEIAARVSKATENGLEFEGGSAAPRKWTELAPASVIALAESLIQDDRPAATVDEHKFLAGVYAVFSGQKAAAKTLLRAAARTPERAEQLPYLLKVNQINLAKGKPATASEGSTPGAAVDGDPATRWTGKNPGLKWLQVDLGKSVTIYRWVVKHFGTRGRTDNVAVDFSLQQSDDGVAYTDVDSVKGNTSELTDRRIPAITARYVRLAITKGGKKGDEAPAQIVEFEVYGLDEGGEPVADLFR